MKKHNGILVVPDIHLNIGLIDRITAHLASNEYSKVIFLGDYFDDWNAILSCYAYTANLLIALKEKLGDKAVFLLGNHELSYITKHHCAGYNIFAAPYVQDFVKQVKPQIAYLENGVLFTHAGVTVAWYSAFVDEDNLSQSAERINSLDLNDGRMFGAGYARGGNEIPSPVWADKTELEKQPIAIRQVVGHTPVERITDDGLVVFCDTFSGWNKCGDFLFITDDNLMQRVKI